MSGTETAPTNLSRALNGQFAHLLVYLVLGGILWFAVQALREGQRELAGLSTGQLIALSWVFVALMQGWIAFGWRSELYFGKFTQWFGDTGFTVFRIGFLSLAAPRLLLIVPVAQSSPDTLGMPIWLRVTFVVVTTPFIVWGMWSIHAYFGYDRAFGEDHFRPEKYRGTGLVKRGLFRHVRNVGYAVVLLLIYHPALFFDSALGLITAAAHHAMVWTNYFCSERPDMREIYG
jgi:protein-S-isoprenylcysteine O-methyltransferase Ste14